MAEKHRRQKSTDNEKPARVLQSRTCTSSSSSISENDRSTPNNNNNANSGSLKRHQKELAIRSVVCVDCDNAPSEIAVDNEQGFDSWSQKYFHVAERHMFRKFSCPYAHCHENFKTLMQLNEHIDKAHAGSRKLAVPNGYHEEVVSKTKACFPVVRTVSNLLAKKKKRSLVAEESETATIDDDERTTSASSDSGTLDLATSTKENQTVQEIPRDLPIQLPSITSDSDPDPGGASNVSTTILISPSKTPSNTAILLGTTSSPVLSSFPSYETQISKKPVELITLDESEENLGELRIAEDDEEQFLTFPDLNSMTNTGGQSRVENAISIVKEEDDDDVFLSFPD